MEFHVREDLLNGCIKELQKLIQIPSVKSTPRLNQPFGEQIDNALTSFLSLAKKMGFATRNLDGYIGIVEMGEGEEDLGILVHLDVVPAGDTSQWKYPPFSGHIAEDRIWGRGTLDDKGPAMAVLFAMHLLNSSDTIWNKKIKLIIGTDEESNWEDIDYYKKHEPSPNMAFTPDGYFPLTFSEKGILTLGIESTIETPTILEKFNAGDVFNSTPETASAIVVFKQIDLQKGIEGISVQSIDESRVLITAHGIPGHTSSPIQEENPIDILLTYIKKILPDKDGFWKVIDFYEEHLKKTNGEGIACKISDEASGELTIAQSKLNFNGTGKVQFANNIRIPSSFSIESVIDRSSASISESSFEMSILERKDPIHLDVNTQFFKDLLMTYNEYFKTDAEPMSISGGTYARAFPNTVAYGALIPGKPLNAHQQNENVELSVIKDWINIYANAIFRIASKGE